MGLRILGFANYRGPTRLMDPATFEGNFDIGCLWWIQSPLNLPFGRVDLEDNSVN